MTMNLWRRTAYFMFLCVISMVWSCAPTQPLPQPRRVVDPGRVQGAVRTADWDVAAVAYENMGEGMDYSDAGLSPVFLVFRNKGKGTPVVGVAEARGVAPDGEYLAYSLEEATTLVFDSETFSVTSSNAAKTGAIGAVLGAGLGALLGAIGGGDNIWKGAAIGGAAGGAAGAAISLPEAERRLKRTIRDELRRYGWHDDPLPSNYTKVGYLYFPGNKIKIERVKIVVREGQRMQTLDVPVVDPKAAAKSD